MKILQFTGRSNTGKTTLIKKIIPELAKRGSVGVIKHLGDHRFALEKGRDTTEFFSAGAAISVGIDAEKSVAAFRITGLDDMLSLLEKRGIDFAIVEGFKKYPFPKIVIGDLEIENCVLRNPTVAEVMQNLDRFETYHYGNYHDEAAE